MKNNIIKRTVCAALAAVSLSACVAVPSALNNTASKISLVNSIEAEAAFQPFYATVSIMGTSLYDSPNRGYKAKLWAFTPLYVTDETRVGRNYYYKVQTPEGEGWVNGRYVDRCSREEYDIRVDFAEGKRYVFGTNIRGMVYRKSPSVDSEVAGRIWFLYIAQIERIWPTGSDGIVWGQLTNGGFLQLSDGKGHRTVELLSKEEADRLNSIYRYYR
ncbi:hypothetical protein [Ruminococcus flavefaciens]|uniref:hypothetical protein n=1 Tax=Ruminococcus flavefaciens TaxID=1265 RepID=UPI0026F2DE72|nr:hypothetical protein [Ruminococcus flavefaciens]